MAFDSRNLLHYFRLLPDGRFMFGGRGGTDASDGGAEAMKAHMTASLRTMFPVFGRVEISHFWRGLVCLAYDLVPYVGALDDRKSVWTALPITAMVSPGKVRRSRGAHVMKPDSVELPPVLTRRLARFPLAFLRPYYLKGAYLWFHYQDEH
jgi:hypothetical protein